MSMTRKRGIALRPEFLRRDENAPAGPERPRKRDGPVGRVAVERHVHPAGPVETAAATLSASRPFHINRMPRYP